MKRAIEEDFPIVEINRLATPERNAFKPIYQMHKWFARRASSVFRAILLGALKPAGTNIMDEFYKDHSKDPDTNGKVVLDPFMGGGTTVVEALRLGCKVVGIDLKGRVKGGRTYEVLTPLERLTGLTATVGEAGPQPLELGLDLSKAEAANGAPLVDVLHLLLAHAEQGERLDHLVERHRGQREPIQAALEYIKQRDPNRWAKACDKLLPFYSDMFGGRP